MRSRHACSHLPRGCPATSHAWLPHAVAPSLPIRHHCRLPRPACLPVALTLSAGHAQEGDKGSDLCELADQADEGELDYDELAAMVRAAGQAISRRAVLFCILPGCCCSCCWVRLQQARSSSCRCLAYGAREHCALGHPGTGACREGLPMQEKMDREAEPCGLQLLWAWADPASEALGVSCLCWNRVRSAVCEAPQQMPGCVRDLLCQTRAWPLVCVICAPQHTNDYASRICQPRAGPEQCMSPELGPESGPGPCPRHPCMACHCQGHDWTWRSPDLPPACRRAAASSPRGTRRSRWRQRRRAGWPSGLSGTRGTPCGAQPRPPA